jgi:hypothetical protein
MAKGVTRVTVAYEIGSKAAPALERLLRDEVPKHISCKFLEASHAEQVPREAVPEERREH